jgi:hypothetical protein
MVPQSPFRLSIACCCPAIVGFHPDRHLTLATVTAIGEISATDRSGFIFQACNNLIPKVSKTRVQ